MPTDVSLETGEEVLGQQNSTIVLSTILFKDLNRTGIAFSAKHFQLSLTEKHKCDLRK